MRTIRLVIEYDGTPFSGWQLQLGTDGAPTVQGALEAGLTELVKEPIRVRGASRTDAGVHARGQVAAFETTKDTLPLRAFERGLVAQLPPTVVVRKVELAEERWDPRRMSRGKRYRYTFWNDVAPTALERHRSWFVRTPLDLEAMQRAADRLLGTHDFEAFRSAGCDARHAVRTMYEIRVWRGEYARVHVDVVGNAFCRNMVRIFAGNLRDVGLRRRTPDDVGALLSSRDRASGAMTAPPQGLCLEEVIYDDRLPPRPKQGRDVAGSTAASEIVEASGDGGDVDDGGDE